MSQDVLALMEIGMAPAKIELMELKKEFKGLYIQDGYALVINGMLQSQKRFILKLLGR